MRNLLMTVMMLIVVVVMFITIVSGTGGIRNQIEEKGRDASSRISSVSP